MDGKRQWEINRCVPRELPEPILPKMESFKNVIGGRNLSMDKLYGKVKPVGKQATKPWTMNRPLAKGAKLPAIGRKKGK